MTPTTKLEAVNTLLSAIGESPINTLNSGLVEATLAEQIVDNISRSTQSRGWSFNTDLEFKLSPDLAGEVALPTNCLHVDMTSLRMSSTSDLVQRGNKLYDRVKNTFAIDDTIEVDIVVLLDFEDLPETARRFITVRAARIFQDRTLGSDTLHGFQQDDEITAWADLQQAEAEVQDYNIFDNYETYSVVDRSVGSKVVV
jgi:hypothetical protein